MTLTKSELFRRCRRPARLAIAGILIFCGQVATAQTSYTSTSATTAWNASRWNNTADTAPYTSTYIANNNVDFTSGTYTFAGMGASINVGNISVQNNVNVNFTSVGSTFATNGAVRTIDVGTGATIDFSTQTFSTASGTGFIKNGNGVLALAGSAYAGGFTLNAGTVILRGVNAMGDGGSLTINGGTIAANANRSLGGKYDTGIFVGGNFTLGATTGLASPTAAISFGNTMNLNGGNRTITIGGNGDYTLSSDISNGALTVAATGTGRLFISGATNTYAGGTTLNSGTLVLNTNALLDAGAVNVNGGELQMGTTGAQSDTVGAVTLSGGTITSTTGVLTGSSFDVQSGSLNANLGGSGALTKTTGGTVTLNGPGMTYTGGTTISAGVLQLANTNQLPNSGNLLVNGGTFDFDTLNDVVGPVTLSSGTITGNVVGFLQSSSFDLQSGTVSGRLAGSGTTLTKNGAGTVTVTSANSYTGITTINNGTLAISVLANANTNSGIGAAPDVMPIRLVFDGGELEYTGATASTDRGFTLNAGGGAIDVSTAGTTVTWAGEATGSGALTKNGGGILELTSDNTYLGGTVVNAGTLAVNNTGVGSGTGSGLVSVVVGTLIGQGRIGGNLTVQSGGIVNPGNSIGTLEVTGNVSLAGTLLVELSNAGGGQSDLLDGSAALTIQPGSTVDFSVLAGPLDDPAYIFANYASQSGTFSNVLNLPAGYAINYAFGGNSIALVPVPEPASFAMLLLGGVWMFLTRRGRRRV